MPERYGKLDFEWLLKQTERARLREDAIKWQKELDRFDSIDEVERIIEIQQELREAFDLLDLNP